MSNLLPTPGYVWYEVNPAISQWVSPDRVVGEVDLKTAFPVKLRDIRHLHDIWDQKEEHELGLSGGATAAAITLNPRGEAGDIIWLPGWGVENQRGGGARGLVAMALLNPDHRITAFEELEGVPENVKDQARTGDVTEYAKLHLDAVDQARNTGQLFISGQSRGGMIATRLCDPEFGLAEDVNALTIIDTPQAVRQNTLAFGFKVGLLDNLVQRKYAHLVETREEDVLWHSDLVGAENGGPIEALGKARREWWLIKAMAKEGLLKSLLAVATGPSAPDIFIWQGTENVGIKAVDMQAVVSEVAPAMSKGKLRYFEAPTGHYSEGHTARFARMVSLAIKESGASK